LDWIVVFLRRAPGGGAAVSYYSHYGDWGYMG